jgi:hypothetical protein
MSFAELFGLFFLPASIILLSVILYVAFKEEGE